MSSRMGEDKARMEIEGLPNITREVQTMTAAGVSVITVITGYMAEERMEAAGRTGCPGLREIRNPDYASTQMFDSVCLGLRDYIERHPEGSPDEGVYFFPVDEPLFTVFTVRKVQEAFDHTPGSVYTASYRGVPGHPLLIRASAIPEILAHDGSRGLRGAVEAMGEAFVKVPVPDPGAGMDADTREEFEKLLAEAEERRRPHETRCLELLTWFEQPPERVAHCRAVSLTAGRMAEQVMAAAMHSDERITREEAEDFIGRVRAAGWLHDIAKGHPDHAVTGASWLYDLGYHSIAPWVAAHTDLPEKDQKEINGAMLVYLADKMVKGDFVTTLEDRFAGARERFREDPAASEAVRCRYRVAKDCQSLVEQVIRGERPAVVRISE